MKKVININFQGRVVMIEEVAYDQLKDYIESLRLHFAEEEGHEEIINDIESRISELFEDVIKKGKPCVTEDDLQAIIDSIGRPSDFEQADLADAGISGSPHTHQERPHTGSEKNEGESSKASADSGRPRHLFRDENNKKIGGVCSGIANFFGIDPTIVRLIALVLLFVYGTGLLAYIILWICVPSSAVQVIGSSQRKLFRDISNKTIGGVCAGLANYFDVSIGVTKAVFVIGALISFPLTVFGNIHFGGFFFPGINSFFISLYIILWIVVPPAVTASDRLSMKGEAVDLNNIKSSVQEDLQDGKKKTMNQHGPVEPVMVTPPRRSGLGDIIVLLCKIFGYFILGVILISIVGALVTLGIAIFGFSPLKDYFIGGSAQNIYGWLSVILLVWMPVLAIIIWIIRRLTKAKTNIGLRIGFIVLLIIGLIAGGLFVNSVYQDFKYVSNSVVTPIALTNGKVDKLTIDLNREPAFSRYQRRWSMFGSAIHFLGDSARINNTRLILQPTTADSFTVSVVKLSNGSSIQDADNRAAQIVTGQIVEQAGNLLVPCAITIDKQNKFRNQYVLVTIGIPVGKKIEVHANRRWSNQFYVRFWGDDWNDLDIDDFNDLNNLEDLNNLGRFDRLHSSLSWDLDREYIMTKNGLEPTEPDLDTRKERIESSEQIIEREQNKIKQEKEKLRESLKEQQDEIQNKIDQQQKELKEKAEKLKNVLPEDSLSIAALGPTSVFWIGITLLRLS